MRLWWRWVNASAEVWTAGACLLCQDVCLLFVAVVLVILAIVRTLEDNGGGDDNNADLQNVHFLGRLVLLEDHLCGVVGQACRFSAKRRALIPHAGSHHITPCSTDAEQKIESTQEHKKDIHESLSKCSPPPE